MHERIARHRPGAVSCDDMKYVLVVTVFAVLAAAPALAEQPGAPALRFFFMDGTVLTGTLAMTRVTIRTGDGKAREVRAANIRDLAPGFVSRTDLARRVGRLIDQLAARSWHDRKAAHEALLAMGPAVTLVLEASGAGDDLERRMRIASILAAFRSPPRPTAHSPAPPRCPIRSDDRLTLHDTAEVLDGHLVTQRVDIASVYGNFSVDLARINAVRRLADARREPKYDAPDRIALTVTGGAVVKGQALTTELTLRTALGKLTVPMAQISQLAFSADRNRVGAILRNGDHLAGEALDGKAISARTLKGKTLRVPIASVASLTVTPGYVPEGLICWNRLDGTPSIVGPAVDFVNVDKFVAGKVDRGVQVSPVSSVAMRVPAAMLKNSPRGTIEFWVKAVSKPVGRPLGANRRVSTSTMWYYEMLSGPVSLTYRNYSSRNVPYVYLRSGGHYVRSDPTQKAKDIRGFGQVGKWNHVAVVWDVKGLKPFAGAPIAMLVNGKPMGRYFPNRSPMAGNPMGDYPFPAHLLLHRTRTAAMKATVAYDELKIWDRVVTDFTP